jgi:hypothetical protein
LVERPVPKRPWLRQLVPTTVTVCIFKQLAFL